jgi:hypothetical protein
LRATLRQQLSNRHCRWVINIINKNVEWMSREMGETGRKKAENAKKSPEILVI